jgi:hypothetical protein
LLNAVQDANAEFLNAAYRDFLKKAVFQQSSVIRLLI